MDLDLQDRAYLVTGASRGLGSSVARALAAEGASVVIAARDQAALDEVAAELGPQAMAVVADISDPASAERLVAAAVARFGRIDGAMLNTGGPPASTPLTTTDEAWREGFETVFLGPLRVARSVAAAMSADPARPAGESGALLFTLSTSVRSPFTGLAISNGLRPGLAMMVKDLADELGPRGVRVNGLMPGRIATDRLFALDARQGAPDVVRRRHESNIPLGRYGEPEEFGRVAAFLLSPAASYIDGAVIPVDGGLLRCL
ncbi:MAG: SDR family oxidoreductase [Candidatus Nanopelagicales bacterium]